MAITFVNAGVESAAASGNVTLAAPASPVNGDIWIACCVTHDQVAMSMDVAWTQILQGNGGGSTNRVAAWWFRYAGSTPSMVVTHAAGDAIIGGVAAFRGCIASGSPIDVASATVRASAATATVAFNDVTTTTANTMIVVCGGMDNDNDWATPLSGFAIAFEDTAAGTNGTYQTTLGLDACVALDYKIQAAIASTGLSTLTAGGANNTGTITFALKEPAAVVAAAYMERVHTTAVRRAAFH
jgi:hypothetical protein